MQTQISAFPKEQKGKYFVGEYLGQIVGVANNYTPSIVDDKLSLSTEVKTTEFDVNVLVGDLLFGLLGFIIIRKTLKFKNPQKKLVNVGGAYV